MNPKRSVLAALFLAVVVPAQAGEAPKPAGRLAEFDKLVADWTAAQKASQDAQKALIASDAYKEAVKAKDNARLTELRGTIARPDTSTYRARALALADQYAGEDGMKVLAYAAANFPDADFIKGLAARIEKDHIGSAEIALVLENGQALARFLGADESDKLLARVVAENKHPLPKAWACYWQAKAFAAIERKRDASKEEKAEAAAKAEKLFADAAALAAGTEHADRIGAPAFEKASLQVGMTVPDIVGEDADGVAFKLSDYRGKVILLDFWGFW